MRFTGWLIFVLLGTCCQLAQAAQTFSIDRFGGIADDGKDDTAAFLAAIKACISSPGSTLTLANGRYDLATRTTPPDGKGPAVLRVSDARGLTIDGHGAELVCHDFATLFQFETCQDVTIRNLKIDYDPLPFTAGQIIADADGYVDLRVEMHHPVQAGFRAESLLPFDPVRHRMGLLKDDLYQPDSEQRTAKIAPDVLRVSVNRKLFKTGDWVILRHQIYGDNALDFRDCERVAIQNVTVYTCPGMGLHADGGADFSLSRFDVTIKPGTGRWYSATADATHFNGTRGKVSLEHCLLESMGDDGVNIHNWYLIVTAVKNPSTFECILGKTPDWAPPLPQNGDLLEIGRLPNPFIPLMIGKVAGAKLDASGKVAVITLESPAPVQLQADDVVGNSSALPVADIRDCTIRRNRARGVLIQTRKALVQNCVFEDNTGAAIQVTSDMQNWWEGMPADGVILRDNSITRVNFGSASRVGAIDVFADVGRDPAPQPVHRQIEIENNTFSGVASSMIHVGSATEVTVRGNKFVHPGPPAVVIDHSHKVVVSGNDGSADQSVN